MATEHMDSLDETFRRFRLLTKPEGRLLVVTADIKRFTTPRFGYSIKVEKDAAEQVVYTKRPGIADTIDILRPIERFRSVAADHGFPTLHHTPLIPTESYLAARPQYASTGDEPILHLLEFLGTDN